MSNTDVAGRGRQGMAGRAEAWCGNAWRGRQGAARPVLVRLGVAWRGLAGVAGGWS
jgi:hypothetical protein